MYATLRSAVPAPGESFRVLHLVSPEFRRVWHQHNEFELNYIVRGSGVRWVGTAEDEFRSGDLVLVAPFTPHSWISRSGGDPTMSEAVVALFRTGALGLDSNTPEWRAIRRLLEQVRGGLSYRATPPIARLMRRLPGLRGTARLLCLLEVLHVLSSEAATPLSPMPLVHPANARALQTAKRAIQMLENASIPPSQSTMAARFGLSPSVFSRQFREATGRTFSEHRDALRLERACVLLQENRLSITETCMAAGFTNISNFNRRFLRLLGQTPREYRQSFLRGTQRRGEWQHKKKS